MCLGRAGSFGELICEFRLSVRALIGRTLEVKEKSRLSICRAVFQIRVRKPTLLSNVDRESGFLASWAALTFPSGETAGPPMICNGVGARPPDFQFRGGNREGFYFLFV